jgi:C-terminal processing protease CtpA/Prc
VELVGRLCHRIERLWPDVERGELAVRALRLAFPDDVRAVDATSLAGVQAVLNEFSRHAELAWDDVPAAPDDPDAEPPGWPAPSRVAVGRRAGFVRSVARRPDGVAVVRLDGLDAVDLSAPYLDAGFALARGAAGVLLDLRANGGGDPGALAHVVDLVAGGPPRHVSDVRYRDRVRQWWTPGRAGAGLDAPLAVLVSGRTYSSGEALAYHVRQQLPCVVVGETTRGAADHITPVRLTENVVGYLPEAYVVDALTGTNWEGTGVVPDVPCPAGEAEDTAAGLLLDA